MRLTLKEDTKNGEPLEKTITSAEELRRKGCIVIKAYNDKQKETDKLDR